MIMVPERLIDVAFRTGVHHDSSKEQTKSSAYSVGNVKSKGLDPCLAKLAKDEPSALRPRYKIRKRKKNTRIGCQIRGSEK